MYEIIRMAGIFKTSWMLNVVYGSIYKLTDVLAFWHRICSKLCWQKKTKAQRFLNGVVGMESRME